jgi:hypothetical protein
MCAREYVVPFKSFLNNRVLLIANASIFLLI